MRPQRLVLSTTGSTPWAPVNRNAIAFGVALGLIPSSNFTGSVSVQHTFDYGFEENLRDGWVTAAQAGSTTITVTNDNGPREQLQVGHGLQVGDSVIIKGSGVGTIDSPTLTNEFGGQMAGDLGWPVASIISQSSYTLTANVSNTATAGPGIKLQGLRVLNHSSLVNVTAASHVDGFYQFPPQAVRLSGTVTTGYVELFVIQGMGR